MMPMIFKCNFKTSKFTHKDFEEEARLYIKKRSIGRIRFIETEKLTYYNDEFKIGIDNYIWRVNHIYLDGKDVII